MDIWTRTEPILLRIKRAYFVTNAKTKVSKVDNGDIINPETKVDSLAFEGIVIEPDTDYGNLWQFRVIDSVIEGRPIGGSRSKHRLIPDPTTGKLRRRKPGEWFNMTYWVPQSALKFAWDAAGKQS